MWNKQKVELVDELFAEQFVIHYSIYCVSSHAEFKDLLKHWFNGIPDLIHTIDDYLIQNIRIVVG